MVTMCEPMTILSAELCSASFDCACSAGYRGSGCCAGSAKLLIYDPVTQQMEVGASASSVPGPYPTKIRGTKKQDPNQYKGAGTRHTEKMVLIFRGAKWVQGTLIFTNPVLAQGDKKAETQNQARLAA